MTILARLGNHPRSLASDMQSRWRTLLFVGIVLLAFGAFGLYASTLLAKTMTIAIAGLLVLAGVLQLSQSLLLHGMPSFAMTVALGAAQIAGGIAIWTHPEWAALAIAVTVTGVLLVQAIAQFMLAFRLDNRGGRWVSILAGLVALLAAAASLAGVRWGDRTAPSWSMSVALLAMGVAYVAIALIHRRRHTVGVVPAGR
ncbi:MAG TPA: DUF308 domain-containing protein [Stenotrophomonas sp.]|jgi:uncharacterized membrane protein HdeD (DUF308 family)